MICRGSSVPLGAGRVARHFVYLTMSRLSSEEERDMTYVVVIAKVDKVEDWKFSHSFGRSLRLRSSVQGEQRHPGSPWLPGRCSQPR